MDCAALEQTLAGATSRLLAARVPAGYWEGELSSSALSTATAVCALELLRRSGIPADADLSSLISAGLVWLAEHQNGDGGWGDTTDSPSNISTTTLCWAAFGSIEHGPEMHRSAIERAEHWLERRAGSLTPPRLTRAICTAYGEDRTFSAPILCMCALAGRLGTGREVWRHVPALPFELAACPPGWFARLGLPVVSYALPALIAIGQARHHHRPTRNPLARALRCLSRARTLKRLEAVQPTSGGFLEAVPLTAFVLMSLVSIGQADHPVASRAAAFLRGSVRDDGSWPIDTNLATWVTTLAVCALTAGDAPDACLSHDERAVLQRWLLGRQCRSVHPYTHAAPGGWAWTPLAGGVPDADDTAGALLALRRLVDGGDTDGAPAQHVRRRAAAGLRWLLGLQNKDGGMPTFCRGWSRLPFDRSTPDLTAHSLRAWSTWREHVPSGLRDRIERAVPRAVRYLVDVQDDDGVWLPLWFGSQKNPTRANPLYGTTRVLMAGRVTPTGGAAADAWRGALRRAAQWVLAAQNQDGGWGAAASIDSSIEETALAVEALAGTLEPRSNNNAPGDSVTSALERGVAWLVERTRGGTRFEPVPIGLYFARLWYSERLYPLIFTVSALERVRHSGRKPERP